MRVPCRMMQAWLQSGHETVVRVYVLFKISDINTINTSTTKITQNSAKVNFF
jgi:hypothetical protein